jgi:hypothetical protein
MITANLKRSFDVLFSHEKKIDYFIIDLTLILLDKILGFNDFICNTD